eukprot:CAMPEP_0115432558 /NCGR_PEP_ID=MMETSP0271-20121206/32169_1 /TAXON_ID=71861 /ORGANISM="Scrippsiella trochoidea, Strain CCMP3099" /LENGTH=257 /DNA_ID=CAMNT_0002857915 /DNA_START=137 /DNA_END=910 /DNA_ORIENTATION=+
MAYLVAGFYEAATYPLEDSKYPGAQDLWSISWLRPFVVLSPIAVGLTIVLCWLLTESHTFEIHKKRAAHKHDRAVQIIALPAVFGLMALASMLPVFELLAGRVDKLSQPWYDIKGAWLVQVGNATSADNISDVGFWNEVETKAFWKYENCFYVADLFEAWTLFQFGKLILEEIGESIAKHGHRSPDVSNDNGQEQETQQSQLEDQEPQTLSQLEVDLIDSHRAVKALTCVGRYLALRCVVRGAVGGLTLAIFGKLNV